MLKNLQEFISEQHPSGEEVKLSLTETTKYVEQLFFDFSHYLGALYGVKVYGTFQKSVEADNAFMNLDMFKGDKHNIEALKVMLSPGYEVPKTDIPMHLLHLETAVKTLKAMESIKSIDHYFVFKLYYALMQITAHTTAMTTMITGNYSKGKIRARTKGKTKAKKERYDNICDVYKDIGRRDELSNNAIKEKINNKLGTEYSVNTIMTALRDRGLR